MPQNDNWKDPNVNWEDDAPDAVQAGAAARPAAAVRSRGVGDELGRFFKAVFGNRRASVLLLTGLLAVCAICGLSAYGLRSLLGGDVTPAATAVARVTPAAGATAPPIGATGAAIGSVPVSPGGGLRANGTSVPAAIPRAVTLGNNSFVVQTLTPNSQGVVEYDKNARNTAYWFNGTLVNYVLGLHATPENKLVFDAYKAGDVIQLDTGNGLLRYRVEGTREIAAEDTSALRTQTTPQLTVLLMGDGGARRRIITARYLDEGQPNVLNPMRFPVNLGDLRVKVTGEKLLSGVSVGLPAGRSYYQVNIELTNISERAVDTGQFYTELLDGNKARFTFSRPGSSAGGAPGWATGSLNPGQVVNVVAGFEVTDNMIGPRLEWRFAANPNTPAVALVSIPFAAAVALPPTPASAASQIDVTIIKAELVPESNQIKIIGTIANRTPTLLTLRVNDITLTSGTTSASFADASPALPLVIPPEQTSAFFFTFARPAGGAPARFKILDQAFEISGL